MNEPESERPLPIHRTCIFIHSMNEPPLCRFDEKLL
jgi:hypothetical protein